MAAAATAAGFGSSGYPVHCHQRHARTLAFTLIHAGWIVVSRLVDPLNLRRVTWKLSLLVLAMSLLSRLSTPRASSRPALNRQTPEPFSL